MRDKKKYKSSLETLGLGLHALQDIFAHSDPFVKVVSYDSIPIFGRGTFFAHQILPNNADDTTFIHRKDSPLSLNEKHRRKRYSQRYTNTKKLTKWYVETYCIICQNIDKHMSNAGWFQCFEKNLVAGIEQALKKQDLRRCTYSFVAHNPISGLSEKTTTSSAVISAEPIVAQSELKFDSDEVREFLRRGCDFTDNLHRMLTENKDVGKKRKKVKENDLDKCLVM